MTAEDCFWAGACVHSRWGCDPWAEPGGAARGGGSCCGPSVWLGGQVWARGGAEAERWHVCVPHGLVPAGRRKPSGLPRASDPRSEAPQPPVLHCLGASCPGRWLMGLTSCGSGTCDSGTFGSPSQARATRPAGGRRDQGGALEGQSPGPGSSLSLCQTWVPQTSPSGVTAWLRHGGGKGMGVPRSSHCGRGQ